MEFKVKFNLLNRHLPVGFDRVQTATKLVGGEPYEGPVEVIPSNEAQTLHTNGRVLQEDIVVGAIPQEYGLVSYDNRKIITIT